MGEDSELKVTQLLSNGFRSPAGLGMTVVGNEELLCCLALDLLITIQLCLPSQMEGVLEGTWGLNATHSGSRPPSRWRCPLRSSVRKQSRGWSIWNHQLSLWGMDFLRSGNFSARILCLVVLDIICFRMCFFNFCDIYRDVILVTGAFSLIVINIRLCFLGLLPPNESMYKHPFCSRRCVESWDAAVSKIFPLLSGKLQSREKQVTWVWSSYSMLRLFIGTNGCAQTWEDREGFQKEWFAVSWVEWWPSFICLSQYLKMDIKCSLFHFPRSVTISSSQISSYPQFCLFFFLPFSKTEFLSYHQKMYY